jgi:3-deoxy-D-manno-octulosonic-acid transferase
MRQIYTILLYLATPFIMLRLLWRAKAQPAYAKRWGERFGRYKTPAINNSIWLHAVSVGEFIAAKPMITRLLTQYPDKPLVITTTTPTGSAEVMKHFKGQVTHVYLPYDLPAVIRRFLKHMQPVQAIIMETELWPNLLHETHKAGIPIMLANARLSVRSEKGYARLGSLTRAMMQCMTVVAAQSAADGARFVSLGVPASRMQAVGNIKFDLNIAADLKEAGLALRAPWGDRAVLIAASTHDGEEALVLHVFSVLKKKHPGLLLIIVPRHPERFDKVHKLCVDAFAHVARRSQNDLVDETTDVLLGDTMGEMMLFYAASDIAFVAGSIKPVGGHNLIEPAVLGLPVLSGYHLHNFIAIRDLLIEADALLVSRNQDELYSQIERLLNDPDMAKAMGQRGAVVVQKNQGALDRHLALILS